MPNIQELLHFRGEALGQFVLISTIFGAFAMSGVIALLQSHEKARLRSFLFVVLSLASLAFIFSTLVSVTILPFMNEKWHVPDNAAHTINNLYGVVVIAIILGTALLGVGVAGVGFMVSPRVGRITLWSTVVTAVLFIVCALVLRSALR
ncbi:MAG: hypothetical protein U0640_01710 [Phycisphaerales bacterium]